MQGDLFKKSGVLRRRYFLFVQQHLRFNLQNQFHLVRAVAGAMLRYYNSRSP
jgi:hypothetical protein